jgi:preprotein translocase subunit SecG
MVTFLLILTIITALLLIVVAALQNSKKEGGGNSLGSMGAHQIIGVKKTGDLLEQVTWGLLITLFVLSITTFTLIKKSNRLPQSPNLERIEQQNLLMEPSQEQNPDSATPTPGEASTDSTKNK